jgi:hypothetical protein
MQEEEDEDGQDKENHYSFSYSEKRTAKHNSTDSYREEMNEKSLLT